MRGHSTQLGAGSRHVVRGEKKAKRRTRIGDRREDLRQSLALHYAGRTLVLLCRTSHLPPITPGSGTGGGVGGRPPGPRDARLERRPVTF
ncbi:hypothetical protein PsYK624_153480 [Phanerochaete sordida]|uniref:Uncharacterized protein n=1 Tax=Phanerochaete sordida TaxID=48140 RepID=A0A9P3LM86_9APHY|nr:hypothetical protein PsYK624_153480 [Phanerochaete sordida]